MQTMSTRVMGSIPRKCKECQTFTSNTVDLDQSFCKMHKCKYRGLFKEWMLGRFWKPKRTERKDVVDHTTLSCPHSQSIFSQSFRSRGCVGVSVFLSSPQLFLFHSFPEGWDSAGGGGRQIWVCAQHLRCPGVMRTQRSPVHLWSICSTPTQLLITLRSHLTERVMKWR